MKKRHIFGILVPLFLFAFIIGGVVGFSFGVASTKAGGRFLRSLVENEESANIKAPKTLKRAHFTLDYPRNWKIDKKDPDYDPDYMFSIDSPGNSYVMFIMGHAVTDPEKNIAEYVIAFNKLFEKPTMKAFKYYGKLSGRGVHMEGVIMGEPTEVRLFSTYEKEAGKSIIIIEQHPLTDSSYVDPGLQLIEETFTLR